MATSAMRPVGSPSRAKRFGLGALALAAGAAIALAGTAAPASAAEGDVSTGTLDWEVNTGWNSYVLNPSWGSDATITAVAPSTTLYTFPGASGTVTSATAADVHTTGGAHWILPEHGIDETLENLRVVVAGTHADIYADISYSFTASFGSIHGTVEDPAVGSTPDVLFATSDSAAITLSGGSATISVPGSSIFGTSDGVAAGFLYGPGGANNNALGADLTLTSTVEGAPAPTTPTITLSKSTLLNPDADTIHVTGAGFSPNANGSFPPVAGHPAGFYVAFGKYASPWQPSAGAPSANRKNGAGGSGLWWVVPQETLDYVAQTYGPSGTSPNPGIFSQYVVLQPDGSFQLDLTVAAVQGAITDTTPGTYGVYTYGAAGQTTAEFETYTPISFASASSSDSETITAEISHSPGGAVTWTIPSNDPVALGGVVDQGAYLQSTGEINPVTVTDTRTYQTNAWTLSGQLGDFTDGGANSIDGKYLGWSPKVTSAGAGATVGDALASGWDSGSGLKSGAVLGSAADGHATGSGSLGADLTLKVPAETPTGSYTATLTLTLLG